MLETTKLKIWFKKSKFSIQSHLSALIVLDYRNQISLIFTWIIQKIVRSKCTTSDASLHKVLFAMHCIVCWNVIITLFCNWFTRARTYYGIQYNIIIEFAHDSNENTITVDANSWFDSTFFLSRCKYLINTIKQKSNIDLWNVQNNTHTITIWRSNNFSLSHCSIYMRKTKTIKIMECAQKKFKLEIGLFWGQKNDFQTFLKHFFLNEGDQFLWT